MTGRTQGLLTRIERVTNHGMIHIWCGLHQLDLFLQRLYKKALDNEFMGILTSLIGHLHRQHNLIQDMQSTCPKFPTTRWVSMKSSSQWLTTKIICVNEHSDNKKPHCTPSKHWWKFLFVVHAFEDEACCVFVGLQGLTTLLSKQRSWLAGLVNTDFWMPGMSGPLTADEIVAVDTTTCRSLWSLCFYPCQIQTLYWGTGHVGIDRNRWAWVWWSSVCACLRCEVIRREC